MIAAFMLYGILIAMLLSFAALVAERGAAALGAARRSIWIVAMTSSLLIPAIGFGTHSKSPSADAITTERAPADSAPSPVMAAAGTLLQQTSSQLPHIDLPRLDAVLSIAWGLTSATLLGLYAFAWVRTRRRLRTWPLDVIAGRSVRLSADVGPAVFGVTKPVIIVPQWLRNLSAEQQALVLEHERQHVAARDPLLLMLALGCVLIAPWNVAMWWQLKRLRFAIEVDCDDRVVQHGADAVIYGETLLQVGRQFLRAPYSAVALIEPPSDLERRIRILTNDRHRHAAVVTSACAALCASLVVAAAQIEPPVIDRTELRLRPPRADVATQVETAVRERYPQLFEPSQTQPAMVNIVLNTDSTIDWSESKLLAAGTTQATVEADERPEATLMKHLRPNARRSIGRLLLSSGVDTPPVFVAFAIKGSDPDAGSIDATARATQRNLVERHFPGIADGSSNPHQLLWVLLDTAGKVLASGHEATSPDPLLINLERRYPGAATSQRVTTELTTLFARPMHDEQGQPLLVTFAWLRKEDQQRARIASAAQTIDLDMTLYRNGIVADSAPLTLTGGVTQSLTNQLLRLDISALDASNELIDIGVAIRVPVGNDGIEFAPKWELVSQPMIRTRLGQEAVIEQGVRYPGKDGAVLWKIVLKPRSVT